MYFQEISRQQWFGHADDVDHPIFNLTFGMQGSFRDGDFVTGPHLCCVSRITVKKRRFTFQYVRTNVLAMPMYLDPRISGRDERRRPSTIISNVG